MATLELHQMRMRRVPQLGPKESRLWTPELKDESKYVYWPGMKQESVILSLAPSECRAELDARN